MQEKCKQKTPEFIVFVKPNGNNRMSYQKQHRNTKEWKDQMDKTR